MVRIRKHAIRSIVLVAAFLVAGCSDAAPPTDPARLDAFDKKNLSFFAPAGYGESALEAENSRPCRTPPGTRRRL
jgi:hypothetical protein